MSEIFCSIENSVQSIFNVRKRNAWLTTRFALKRNVVRVNEKYYIFLKDKPWVVITVDHSRYYTVVNGV